MLFGRSKTIFNSYFWTEVKYVCDIYDWDGKGEIDLFFLGDICYALGLNITKKVCEPVFLDLVGLHESCFRPVLDRDRLMRRARSSPSTMMLSRRSRPLLPPLTPRDPTTTMLSSSSSTTKTATAPWCLLSLTTSSAILVMRSPRKISRGCLLNFAILRMRMACSHTWASLIDWLARLKWTQITNLLTRPPI